MKEIAIREGMPAELLLLTFIESSLNPMAESKKGAVGLWQFLYATGIDYGLNKKQSI
jgi:membrane-bound lytic murein transglycosylase D